NGSLDASFGVGGIATSTFGNQYQSALSVAIQADGKIVASGTTGACPDKKYCYFSFALARYNSDGSPDTSFDTDGKVTTTLVGNYDSAAEVLVQGDGKIVAAGRAPGLGGYGPFAVTRYNADGSLDTSFSGDGMVMTEVGNAGYARSATLQADGKILVAGSTYVDGHEDFAFVRLNSDGSLDTSFDEDGKLTTDFANGSDHAFDIAIPANGKIIAGGFSRTGTSDFALSRYNADGSLDAAFDGDGKVTTSLLDVSSAINAVTIDQGRNHTFLVGYSGNETNDDFAITRVDGPKKITPVGNSDDRANAAALSAFPVDRVFVAGSSSNGSDSDFAIVRYFPFGLDIDTSLNQTGKVTTDFGANDTATAIAVQPDYKFVVVGQTGGGAALAVARYNFDGSLDASFGSGGKVILQSIQHAKAMAIQPDGKIIAAGSAPHTEPPFGDNFALARFNSDGSLDTSFDGDGIVVTRLGFTSRINAIALQQNGRIVASGFTAISSPGSDDFALARYNADGSLDTSFEGDGKVTTSFGGASTANAVRIQRNSKIVAVGSSTKGLFSEFALARYNPNGSLDTTFDTDGKQTTDFYGDNDMAFAAGIQADGRILAAGSAHREGKTDFATARYIGDRAAQRSRFDFDGDGRADVSVFRPSDRVWYLDRSTDGFSATQFGLSTDKITPADYDGDGRTDISVYRDGTWYWLNSSDNSFSARQFGTASDIPVPADYDGDGGVSELAVYRNGTWWILNLSNNQVTAIQFGLATDKPVVGDYDGDGRADQAVYRNGEWHLNRSSLGYTVINFGLSSDRPVVGDYDGDGKTDLAVYRNGTWYVQQSTAGFRAFQWGIGTDIPAPADYDGDGKTDAAVYRDGTWYLLQSTSGSAIHRFGLADDKPAPSAYVP
ncbi:MAG TPA: FG-GAP-like repeat-containing protein, partial [Pyrinomonadaceae bacterium]